MNLEQILKNVKSCGYHVIPNYWDAEKCESAVRQIDEFIENSRGFVWKDSIGADKRIFAFDRANSLAAEFYRDDLVNTVFNHLTKASSSLRTGFILAARIDYMENNRGSGQGWHRDDANKSQFKAFIYLTDVDENNGPLEFLPRSFTRWCKIKMWLKYGFGWSQDRFESERQAGNIARLKPETIIGKKGALIFANVSCLHRGRPLREGTRHTFTYYMWDNGIIPSHIERICLSAAGELL